MALLSFEHVEKRHRDGRQEVRVLRDASFEIAEGELVGLWGMRGSGKSTVLRLAAGIESPDGGAVKFDGCDVGRLSGERRARLLRAGGIGIVCTDRRPTLNQSALEHVALPLLASAHSLREAREPARRALSRAGALRHAESSVASLPRAALIRVMIAQAIVNEPRLLLVDEPAAFLSMREADEIFAVLGALGSNPRLSVLLASEDLRPLRGATKVMSIGGGVVRAKTLDSAEVLPFPGPGAVGRGAQGR